MSILQEYEKIRNQIGHQKYDMIDNYLNTICPKENYAKYEEELKGICKLPYDKWLYKKKELEEKYRIVHLSDILYKQVEWEKFDEWYNENYLHRKVEILDVWESDFDDVRCNAILYQNNKVIGNFIACFSSSDVYDLTRYAGQSNEKAVKTLIYDNFNKYTSLPKISKCSKLLQEIYDNVCESDSSMCYVSDDDWEDLYSDKYNEKDILRLKEEVKKYKLDNIITFDDNNYKIIGWGNLECAFNDEREIRKSKEIER